MGKTKTKRRQFDDFCYLMGKLKQKLRATGQFIAKPTASECALMFQQAEGALGVPPKTPKGRLRRWQQLEWTTVVYIVRKAEKLS